MSATLVEKLSFRHPHRHRVHKHNLSLSLLPPTSDVSQDERATTQLVLLASQHHASEYNRLKFGPKGCPILYIPMSFHMPEYVKELQSRQIKCTEQKSWWPCAQQERTITTANESTPEPLTLGPGGSSIADTDHLQKELSAAISTSLPSPPLLAVTASACAQVKTSETHPLNISPIISSELLHLISSHLTQLPTPSPVMFDIPPIYQLDRVTSQDSPSLAPLPPSPTCSSSDISFVSIAKSLRTPPARFLRQSSINTAIQAAINSGLRVAPRNSSTTTFLASSYHERFSTTCSVSPLSIVKPTDNKRPVVDGRQSSGTLGQTACSVSLDLSVLSLPQLLTSIDNNSSASPTSVNSTSLIETSSSSSHLHTSHSPSEHFNISSPAIDETRFMSSFLRPSSLQTCSPHPPFSLGNLFLSSCPGKKVRLSGPIKGRCGVYRDLFTDLKRMKDLGVACIICCLDDVELELLGVPWSEYARTAHEVGVDVLRIPIPEGLTPPSLSSLDAHMSHIIYTCTLKGLPALVHCRGGVGRAGLIACCWMLKLGLCGWIETDLPGGTRPGNGTANLGPGLRRDTMQLVERAISVVRSRRSMKAVETYEQVKFLVDFVEYLREGKGIVTAM